MESSTLGQLILLLFFYQFVGVFFLQEVKDHLVEGKEKVYNIIIEVGPKNNCSGEQNLCEAIKVQNSNGPLKASYDHKRLSAASTDLSIYRLSASGSVRGV